MRDIILDGNFIIMSDLDAIYINGKTIRKRVPLRRGDVMEIIVNIYNQTKICIVSKCKTQCLNIGEKLSLLIFRRKISFIVYFQCRAYPVWAELNSCSIILNIKMDVDKGGCCYKSIIRNRYGIKL